MGEDFARTILNQSVARTAVAVGFKEASQDCVDVLSDIVAHYVKSIGERTVEQAEFGGRAHPGVQDVLVAVPVSKTVIIFSAFVDRVCASCY